MVFWELMPEALQPFGLISYVTWKGYQFGWRPPLMGKASRASLQLHPGKSRNWEKHEKTQYSSHRTTRRADLAVFWGTASAGLLSISSPCLPVGDFSQPSVGTSAFPVAEVRGSPHQLTLSRNSQCSDVVEGKRNPQIAVYLPVTNVPWCDSYNAKTLLLWN
jgi:hypothetical protein